MYAIRSYYVLVETGDEGGAVACRADVLHVGQLLLPLLGAIGDRRTQVPVVHLRIMYAIRSYYEPPYNFQVPQNGAGCWR